MVGAQGYLPIQLWSRYQQENPFPFPKMFVRAKYEAFTNRSKSRMKVNIETFGENIVVNALWLKYSGILRDVPFDGDELTKTQWTETESAGARQTFRKLVIKLPRKQRARGRESNKRQRVARADQQQAEPNDTDEDEGEDPVGAEYQEGVDEEDGNEDAAEVQ